MPGILKFLCIFVVSVIRYIQDHDSSDKFVFSAPLIPYSKMVNVRKINLWKSFM